MTITELEFHPVEIRMDGVLDVSAAQEVLRAVEQLADRRDVRIDVTHVREFHDFGVAFLAHGLAPRREQVTVRGLRQHQERLLGYLGLGKLVESESGQEVASA